MWFVIYLCIIEYTITSAKLKENVIDTLYKMAKMITSPSEVTEEWLKETLQLNLKEDSIEVVQFEKITAKNGYLSGAFKAQVKIKDQVQKLFIKSILDPDDPFRYMMDKNAMDRIEIQFYNTFLPQLIQYEKEKCQGKSELEQGFVPKVLAADYCLDVEKRGFYLVMEDISDQFDIVKDEEGLSFVQITNALEKLARFHAIGYGFSKAHPDAVKDWDLEPLYEKFKSDPFMDGFHNDFQPTVDLFASLDPALKEPLEIIGKRWDEIYDKSYFLNEKTYLTHTDFWLNNILFSANDSRILDWQCMCLAHPAMDIAFIIGTGLSPKHINQWINEIIEKYFEKFQSSCKDININCPFSLDEIMEETKTNGMMGLVIFLIMGWDVFAVKQGFQERGLEAIRLAIKENTQYFKE